MKKIILAVVIAAASISAANAAEHVITGGYAQTKSDGVKLSGLNLKYGYTPDESAVGVMSSLTITGKSEDYSESGYKASADYAYGSLMVGASYKVNEYVKPYALVGVGRGAVDAKFSGYGSSYHEKDTDTNLAYGVGVQFTPVKGFTIDAGYEGSKAFGSQVNSFVVGAGYRF